MKEKTLFSIFSCKFFVFRLLEPSRPLLTPSKQTNFASKRLFLALIYLWAEFNVCMLKNNLFTFDPNMDEKR